MLVFFLCAAAAAAVKAPPAWRTLQLRQLPAGLALRDLRLRGAPPCLRTLRKVGQGHCAAWRLATFAGGDDEWSFDVNLALDANPEEPCCKLQMIERGGDRRLGFLLLACLLNTISKDLRRDLTEAPRPPGGPSISDPCSVTRLSHARENQPRRYTIESSALLATS